MYKYLLIIPTTTEIYLYCFNSIVSIVVFEIVYHISSYKESNNLISAWYYSLTEVVIHFAYLTPKTTIALCFVDEKKT